LQLLGLVAAINLAFAGRFLYAGKYGSIIGRRGKFFESIGGAEFFRFAISD
jgi:hypothetical protein